MNIYAILFLILVISVIIYVNYALINNKEHFLDFCKGSECMSFCAKAIQNEKSYTTYGSSVTYWIDYYNQAHYDLWSIPECKEYYYVDCPCIKPECYASNNCKQMTVPMHTLMNTSKCFIDTSNYAAHPVKPTSNYYITSNIPSLIFSYFDFDFKGKTNEQVHF